MDVNGAQGFPERYARHMPLGGFGPEGQARLEKAAVCVIGAGGLGSGVLYWLAGAGVGQITIVDSDYVTESNLNRQILYTPDDIGKGKAAAAAMRLSAFNDKIKIKAIGSRFEKSVAETILHGCGLVLDCTDNFSTRFDLSESCRKNSLALVSASAQGWGGQLLTQTVGGPCLHCLFPGKIEENDAPSPDESGVAGAVCGVMAGLQAGEALRILLGQDALYGNSFLHVDISVGRFRAIPRYPNPHCPLCGTPV